MIAAKTRVEEVPPPRGRWRYPFKQFGQGSYLADEAATMAERAGAAAERQLRVRLGRSSKSPT
jgi:hypothetical protein